MRLRHYRFDTPPKAAGRPCGPAILVVAICLLCLFRPPEARSSTDAAAPNPDIAERLQITSKRFGVEPELTAKVAKLRCRIYEVPISYYGRDYAHGKKIGLRDAFEALWCIVKYNLFSSPAPPSQQSPGS